MTKCVTKGVWRKFMSFACPKTVSSFQLFATWNKSFHNYIPMTWLASHLTVVAGIWASLQHCNRAVARCDDAAPPCYGHTSMRMVSLWKCPPNQDQKKTIHDWWIQLRGMGQIRHWPKRTRQNTISCQCATQLMFLERCPMPHEQPASASNPL